MKLVCTLVLTADRCLVGQEIEPFVFLPKTRRNPNKTPIEAGKVGEVGLGEWSVEGKLDSVCHMGSMLLLSSLYGAFCIEVRVGCLMGVQKVSQLKDLPATERQVSWRFKKIWRRAMNYCRQSA